MCRSRFATCQDVVEVEETCEDDIPVAVAG